MPKRQKTKLFLGTRQRFDSVAQGRPKTLGLDITQEVIDRSVPKSATCCVLAEAIKDVGGRNVNVTAERAAFTFNGLRYNYTIPAREVPQIIDFDRRGRRAVKPHKVLLSGLSCSVKPVVTRERKAATAASRKRNKVVRRKRRQIRRTNQRFEGVRIIRVPT